MPLNQRANHYKNSHRTLDGVCDCLYDDSMKTAALFAGIGGLQLGLEKAGITTLMTSEIWEPAQAVLAAHFQVTNSPDVRAIRSLPRNTDVVTAGFPCQDLSQAGMTAGIRGERSGLVD